MAMQLRGLPARALKVPPAPKRRPLQARALWTPGSGYRRAKKGGCFPEEHREGEPEPRPRGDDPHRRPTLQLREGAEAPEPIPALQKQTRKQASSLGSFSTCS